LTETCTKIVNINCYFRVWLHQPCAKIFKVANIQNIILTLDKELFGMCKADGNSRLPALVSHTRSHGRQRKMIDKVKEDLLCIKEEWCMTGSGMCQRGNNERRNTFMQPIRRKMKCFFSQTVAKLSA